MEGYEDAHKEGFVFVLDGNSEPVDNSPKNLKQLRNAIPSFRLINESPENVIHTPPDKWSQIKEFEIKPVKSGL